MGFLLDFVQLFERCNSLTVTAIATNFHRIVVLHCLYDVPEVPMSYLKPFPSYFWSKQKL
jgi:hypothetical protein